MVTDWLVQHGLELFGTASGLVYLYLEIRQKPIMWVLGFITSLVYVFVFFQAKFYADMSLNVYYVVISVYGFFLWMGHSGLPVRKPGAPAETNEPGNTHEPTEANQPGNMHEPTETNEPGKSGEPSGLRVRRVSLRLALKLMVVAALLLVIMGQILDRYTDSPVPWSDALTTSLSIVATWMLARKYLDHWFVWFFVNFFSMYLYLWRGLYPTAVLFFFYGTMSVVGFLQWKKSCNSLRK